MNDDVRFYDFDLNLLRIIPAVSKDVGYSSINATIELNGSGSVEFVFFDDELKQIIENAPDEIIIVWRDFQGFITSYKFTDKENRIFGMTLNGLLHRIVIPPLYNINEATDDEGNVTQEKIPVIDTVENISRNALTDVEWLTLGTVKEFSNTVEYQTSRYMTADTYIQDLLALDGAGYRIYIDFGLKQFIFDLIKPKNNSLMLSENNLNAYEMELSYNNKKIAFGGWYEEEQPDDAQGNAVASIWKYITLDNKLSGIHKIDTILDSVTVTEAMNELKQKKAIYEISAMTRNILHNADYSLGDIIKVQKGNITTNKKVTGINIWKEISYNEQPILSEVS